MSADVVLDNASSEEVRFVLDQLGIDESHLGHPVERISALRLEMTDNGPCLTVRIKPGLDSIHIEFTA